mgnify:CR=1 FL=1
MEPLVRLRGCKGCSGDLHAYMSCDKENVQKALELGIACTGANDNGAYNIYFDDSAELCCEYMRYCVQREFKKVVSVEEAVEWMDQLMN